MPARYMLDTNMASHVVRGGHPRLRRKFRSVPLPDICVSAVTEAELLFGLAKRPLASTLHVVIREFLLRVDRLAWDSAAAEVYGHLRSALERKGRPLGALDMLIAAHALAAGAILVTADRSFSQVPRLKLADWTKP